MWLCMVHAPCAPLHSQSNLPCPPLTPPLSDMLFDFYGTKSSSDDVFGIRLNAFAQFANDFRLVQKRSHRCRKRDVRACTGAGLCVCVCVCVCACVQ